MSQIDAEQVADAKKRTTIRSQHVILSLEESEARCGSTRMFGRRQNQKFTLEWRPSVEAHTNGQDELKGPLHTLRYSQESHVLRTSPT